MNAEELEDIVKENLRGINVNVAVKEIKSWVKIPHGDALNNFYRATVKLGNRFFGKTIMELEYPIESYRCHTRFTAFDRPGLITCHPEYRTEGRDLVKILHKQYQQRLISD